MNRPSVLVTGATGFIGSHLVHHLVNNGERVIGTSASGSFRRLENLRGQVKLDRANVGCFTDVLRLVESHRPGTIYHLGALLAPACDDNPEAGIQINAMGTYHLLEAARLLGVRQVIFASSMSVFSGACSTEPVIHDYSVTRPDFVYGAAKLFSENLGLFYKRKYGLDYRGLRLPNVIGPGADTKGYLEFFNKTIEENARGRSYTVYVRPQTRIPVVHVEDAARAFIELAGAPLSRIRTTNYTILGPTPLPTHADLVAAVTSRLPAAQVEYQVNESIQKLIDSVSGKPYEDAYARKEWGWKHRYGLAEMVDSFLRKQPICA